MQKREKEKRYQWEPFRANLLRKFISNRIVLCLVLDICEYRNLCDALEIWLRKKREIKEGTKRAISDGQVGKSRRMRWEESEDISAPL